MCSADLVEVTVKGDEVIVIGSDLVQMRNRLELMAEKEEKEQMDIREVIDIATQAQDHATKIEAVKRWIESKEYECAKYIPQDVEVIAAIIGAKVRVKNEE